MKEWRHLRGGLSPIMASVGHGCRAVSERTDWDEAGQVLDPECTSSLDRFGMASGD